MIVATDPDSVTLFSFESPRRTLDIIMSATPNSLTSHPLECMRADDYEAADAARQRLTPKSRLRIFSSLSNLRKRKQSNKSVSQESTETNQGIPAILRSSTGAEDNAIGLDGSAITDSDISKDIYRWATLYENQRGCVHLNLFDCQLSDIVQINNIFNTLLL